MLLANPPHEAQGSPNAASSNRDPSLPQYNYRTLLDVVQNFTPGLWHFYALITECSVPRPTSKGETTTARLAVCIAPLPPTDRASEIALNRNYAADTGVTDLTCRLDVQHESG